MLVAEANFTYEERYGEWHAYWVDCSTCGPTPPIRKNGFLFTPEPWKAACSICNEHHSYRQITIPKEVNEKGRCMKSCHNGKSNGYCSCVCRGRCHGQGVCKEKVNAN